MALRDFQQLREIHYIVTNIADLKDLVNFPFFIKNLTYLSLDKAAVKVYGNIGYKSGTSYHPHHDVHSTGSGNGMVGVAFDPNALHSMHSR